MESMEIPKFYNPKQIADILSVSERTVRTLCYSGEISFNRVGSQIRISEDSLKSYLNKTENIKEN